MKRFPTLLCLTVTLASAFCVAGCSSSEDPSSEESRDAQSRVRAMLQEGPDPAGVENACLLAYAAQYDQLLPLSLAAAVTGSPAEQARTNYSRSLADPARHELRYSWPSERVRMVGLTGRQMPVPRNDVMGLGGMQALSHERFQERHRPTTEEDRKAFDRSIETSDQESLQSEQAKNLASGFGGYIADITQAYRDVPGVGQAAAYNTAQSMLYVQDRGVTFYVLADLSDEDHDANQAKAVEVARRVLARCP
jgi:hypothetical protein